MPEQKKPFEPPPWEREAFDRFQEERAKARAAEELEEELRRVRTVPAQEPESAPRESAAPQTADVPKADEEPRLPEARIETMLAQLRMEEPAAVKASRTVVNVTIGILLLVGVVIIVQGVVLFGDARSTDASLNMLAATMSFVMFLTGVGFIGGAALLYRKYH